MDNNNNSHKRLEMDHAAKDHHQKEHDGSKDEDHHPIRYIRWSNDREDPHWFNVPLDCFFLREQLSDDKPIPDQEASKDTKLVMFCTQGSDLWRKTSYGFTKDDGHAYLGAVLKQNRAIEVGFSVEPFRGQFDQGGLLLRADENNWVKAGVEFSDGLLHLSVVVTRDGYSDWSTTRWPLEWQAETEVVISADRMNDSFVIRIRLAKESENWRFLRLCYAPEANEYKAGPYSCAPTRNGLFVEFSRYVERPGKPLH